MRKSALRLFGEQLLRDGANIGARAVARAGEGVVRDVRYGMRRALNAADRALERVEKAAHVPDDDEPCAPRDWR